MNILARKILPDRVTPYDLFKFFAVVTMIVDHVGAYFYPEDMWWRDVGRLSAPVWLFLIGFARSRDLSPRLWIGALVLIVASFICGDIIFPTNILVLVIIIRLTIDKVGPYIISERARLWVVAMSLFAAMFLASFITDYGSIGFLIALWGYLARQRIEGKPVKDETAFVAFAGLGYFVMAYLTYDFKGQQNNFLMAGLFVVFAALYNFRSDTELAWAQKLPGFVKSLLRFCGSRTLEIYVAHLLLFKVLAAAYGIDGHSFMDWRWIDI